MFAVISKGKERISLGNRFLRSRCKTGEGDFEQSERKLRFPISQSGWLRFKPEEYQIQSFSRTVELFLWVFDPSVTSFETNPVVIGKMHDACVCIFRHAPCLRKISQNV